MPVNENKTSAAGRWQHRYLSNYHKDENGKYVYDGDSYDLDRMNGGAAGKAHPFLPVVVLSIIAIAATIASDIVPAPGQTSRWVFLPEAGSFVFGAITLWKIFDLLSEKLPSPDYVYERTVTYLPTLCVMWMLMSVLTFASELIQFLQGKITVESSVAAGCFAVFLVLTGGTAVLVYFVWKKFRALKWIKVEGKTKS